MVHCACSTKGLEVIIGTEKIGRMIPFIDALYLAYPSMRECLGAGLAFGVRVLTSLLTMQKLSTRSTTESEAVDTSDGLPKMLHAQLFIETQGYSIKENILFQDN